ncbi:protein of unknown function [Pararobbsia alpina]
MLTLEHSAKAFIRKQSSSLSKSGRQNFRSVGRHAQVAPLNVRPVNAL